MEYQENNLQRTDAWYKERLGKVTGSNIHNIMNKTKNGYSTTRLAYMNLLLCARLTGYEETTFVTKDMQRGIDLEPVAKNALSNLLEFYGLESEIIDTGFINHPEIRDAGASPDGLLGKNTIVEIKCPRTATHLEFIRTGEINKKYLYQMQWTLECTGRSQAIFFSYDDRLPTPLSEKLVIIQRDDNLINEMKTEVLKFLDELYEMEFQINNHKLHITNDIIF